jgi:5-formyltetrahydrofolate cyclo-ligase
VTKAEIRQSVQRLVAGITTGQRAAFSAAICERLEQQQAWHSARRVLLFASLPDEPDISELSSRALAAGRTVLLPRFDSATGKYVASVMESTADLVRGRYGVLEPAAGCSHMPLNQLDFILVPGVAFDFIGRRLGRGKGFYDRLLSEVRGHKCGVCYDLQVVGQLPEEPHDIRLDSILTPTRWHLCQGAV